MAVFYASNCELMSESLATLLVAIAVWHLLKSRDRARVADAAICGAAMGAACLVKPALLVFVPLAALLVTTRRQARQKVIRQVRFFFCVACLLFRGQFEILALHAHLCRLPLAAGSTFGLGTGLTIIKRSGFGVIFPRTLRNNPWQE